MTGELILPDDVEIVPLSRFPAIVREHIGAGNHEYAVSRVRSRVPTKVIDGQEAELLRQFKMPTTLVQAILRFSKMKHRQPTQILEEVYPFLESCLSAGLLVEPGSASEAIRESLEKDALIAGYQVQECIQVLFDTELYRVRDGDRQAALKIVRLGAGDYGKKGLAREAAVLRRLDGGVAPRLLFAGETSDGRAFLLLEWISGELCGEKAMGIRARSYESLPPALVSLCANILDAYATLHALGVIHSDVHTNNLLVMDDGRVRIIDHGLSRCDADDLESQPPRGGVGFFFEPEYARAILSGSAPPRSTASGEQYSVAALIYFLLSGQHYLDFSYGKEEMLRQIVELAPVPLVERGLPAATPIDEVLSRALSKDPAARFPGLSPMTDAFHQAVAQMQGPAHNPESLTTSTSQAIEVEVDQRSKDWLRSMLDSLSDVDMELPLTGLKYPTASLTFGSSGVAYGVFRIACAREDASICALAERWLDRADREIGEHAGFYHADLQITPEIVGRISPYHTPSGVACVQALLAHACGDWNGRSAATERFLGFSDQKCENLDLALGRSGTLLALSMLVDAFRWDQNVDPSELIETGNRLLADLWREFDAMPSISETKSRIYLGMAHGWAGYLYATLRWTRSAQTTPPDNCQARLQQLAEAAHWRGSRACWPSRTVPGSPILGGWCNGSAGFVFLWTLADRLSPNSQWRSLAEAAGRDAFHARAEDASLCCGLTGKAYSQLNLYKHTGDRRWLDNAITLTRLAVRKTETEVHKTARIPLSLYKGDIGLAVLIAELEHPESSALPFFEDESWPMRTLHN